MYLFVLVMVVSGIDELRALVANNIPEGGTDGVYLQYDDLFFLRYILSFGTAQKAKTYVLECFEHRATPEFQEIARLCCDESFKKDPVFNEMQKYQTAGVVQPEVKPKRRYKQFLSLFFLLFHNISFVLTWCSNIDKNPSALILFLCDGVQAQVTLGPTVVIRGGMSNNDALFNSITQKDILRANFMYREFAFHDVDAITRRTGKLAKQILVFDMEGTSISQMMDQRQANIHKAVTEKSAVLYPQLLSKMCMVSILYIYIYIAFFK